MKIILAAGGTGGHLFPAMALGEALQKKGHEVLLITDTRGQSYPGLNPHLLLKVLPLGRYRQGILQKLTLAFSLIGAFVKTLWFVLRYKPKCIVGFGGFPSAPAVVAGILCGIPVIGYDLNAYIGRVNRFFAPFMKKIGTAFPQSFGMPQRYASKLQYVGGISRPDMQPVPYVPWRKPDPFIMVVLGGSQGAKSFDTLIPGALEGLSPDLYPYIQIYQQSKDETLPGAYARMGIKASCAPFLKNMGELLQQAHLVICRAGGSTVGELLHMNRPAILIPYPHAMDDHQYYNGKNLEIMGAGWIVREGKNSVQELQHHLKNIFAHAELLKKAATVLEQGPHESAVQKLIDLIEDCINNKDYK